MSYTPVGLLKLLVAMQSFLDFAAEISTKRVEAVKVGNPTEEISDRDTM